MLQPKILHVLYRHWTRTDLSSTLSWKADDCFIKFHISVLQKGRLYPSLSSFSIFKMDESYSSKEYLVFPLIVA